MGHVDHPLQGVHMPGVKVIAWPVMLLLLVAAATLVIGRQRHAAKLRGG